MSEEKKYTNNEEICEEAKKLTEDDLENVNGGGPPISGGDAAGIGRGYKSSLL